jgi:hypothetical protein
MKMRILGLFGVRHLHSPLKKISIGLHFCSYCYIMFTLQMTTIYMRTEVGEDNHGNEIKIRHDN